MQRHPVMQLLETIDNNDIDAAIKIINDDKINIVLASENNESIFVQILLEEKIDALIAIDEKYNSLRQLTKNEKLLFMSHVMGIVNASTREKVLTWLLDQSRFELLETNLTKAHLLAALGKIDEGASKTPDLLGLCPIHYFAMSGREFITDNNKDAKKLFVKYLSTPTGPGLFQGMTAAWLSYKFWNESDLAPFLEANPELHIDFNVRPTHPNYPDISFSLFELAFSDQNWEFIKLLFEHDPSSVANLNLVSHISIVNVVQTLAMFNQFELLKIIIRSNPDLEINLNESIILTNGKATSLARMLLSHKERDIYDELISRTLIGCIQTDNADGVLKYIDKKQIDIFGVTDENGTSLFDWIVRGGAVNTIKKLEEKIHFLENFSLSQTARFMWDLMLMDVAGREQILDWLLEMTNGKQRFELLGAHLNREHIYACLGNVPVTPELDCPDKLGFYPVHYLAMSGTEYEYNDFVVDCLHQNLSKPTDAHGIFAGMTVAWLCYKFGSQEEVLKQVINSQPGVVNLNLSEPIPTNEESGFKNVSLLELILTNKDWNFLQYVIDCGLTVNLKAVLQKQKMTVDDFLIINNQFGILERLTIKNHDVSLIYYLALNARFKVIENLIEKNLNFSLNLAETHMDASGSSISLQDLFKGKNQEGLYAKYLEKWLSIHAAGTLAALGNMKNIKPTVEKNPPKETASQSKAKKTASPPIAPKAEEKKLSSEETLEAILKNLFGKPPEQVSEKALYSTSMDKKNNITITFSDTNETINKFVAIKNFITANNIKGVTVAHQPATKKIPIATFKLVGSVNNLLTLFKNNKFIDKVNNEIIGNKPLTTRSSEPVITSNTTATTMSSTSFEPVVIDQGKWQAYLQRSLCYMQEIKIEWNDREACFVVDLVRKNNLLHLRAPGSRHQDEEEFKNIDNNFVRDEIFSRVSNQLDTQGIKVEHPSSLQLKIYPDKQALPPIEDVAVAIFSRLDKTRPQAKKAVKEKTISNIEKVKFKVADVIALFNNLTGINCEFLKGEIDQNKLQLKYAYPDAESPKQLTPEKFLNVLSIVLNKDEPHTFLFSEMGDHAVVTLNLDDAKLEKLNKNLINLQQLFANEYKKSKLKVVDVINFLNKVTGINCEFLSGDLEKNKLKLQYTYASAKNPMQLAPQKFLEILTAVINADEPNTMSFHDKGHEAIVIMKIDENKFAMLNKNLNNLQTHFANEYEKIKMEKKEEEPFVIQFLEMHQLPKEEAPPKVETKATISNQEIGDAFVRVIQQAQRDSLSNYAKNMNYHLNQLTKELAKGDGLEAQIERKAWLLHLFRLIDLISSAEAALANTLKKLNPSDPLAEKNIFYDWRNVLRHAYERLDWQQFYNLINPLVITLQKIMLAPVSSTGNVKFFPQAAIDVSVIFTLIENLEPFQDNLKNRKWHKGNLAKLHAENKALLQNIELLYGWHPKMDLETLIDACIMVHSLIGEVEKGGISNRIYREVGHYGQEELYENFRNRLVNQFLPIPQSARPNTSV